MRYFFFILFCLLQQENFAQQQYNLVPNWSFETYIVCPNSLTNNPPPPPWFEPTNYSLSYCNACSVSPYFGVPHNSSGSGYQNARTGNAYLSFFFLNGPSSNQRNYYSIKLNDSLILGHNYYVEFFISLHDGQKLASNNISALISKTAQYVDTFHYPNGVLFANAQVYNYGNPIISDTMNWVKVSSIFRAQGGENYLTLGNFKDDNSTDYIVFQPTGYNGAGYYIDDVSVIPLDNFNLKADAGRDTTITIGDSAFIGGYTNGLDSLKWQIQSTGIAIDSTRPGFWVHPLVGTCYVLTQTVNGFTSSDTVCINVQPLPLKFLSYELSLRGTKQSIENLWQTANEINVSHFNIQRSNNNKDFTTIGKLSAQNKNYNEYSFIDKPTINEKPETLWYRIESIDKDGKKQYSVTKSLNIQHSASNITIYPNPAKNIVTISSKETIKEISIINPLGQVLYSKQINNNQLSNIHLQSFAKGLVVVKIITVKGEIISKKLIIE